MCIHLKQCVRKPLYTVFIAERLFCSKGNNVLRSCQFHFLFTQVDAGCYLPNGIDTLRQFRPLITHFSTYTSRCACLTVTEPD